MGCASSHQRILKAPRARSAAQIWSLPEDPNFLHVEVPDSSKTITVVDRTLTLPRSSVEKPIRPLSEDHENFELQLEVSDSSKTTTTPIAIGIFSLPTELICHILLLLHFKDLSCCVLTCKAFWHVAQNFVDVQIQLELYAQGFTETPTLDWVDVSSKMYSLKRLASMWQSDFHLNSVSEQTVAIGNILSPYIPSLQSVKCGIWWMSVISRLFIRECDTNFKSTQTWPEQSFDSLVDMPFTKSVVVDPLQDLAVMVSYGILDMLVHRDFSMTFRLASSQRPHPDSPWPYLNCMRPPEMDPDHDFRFVDQPAICGDRVVALYYYTNHSRSTSNIFILVVDWRKGHAKGSSLYELGGTKASFHLLDEQRIIVIGPEGGMALYTLELDGSPRRRITYVLPSVQRDLDYGPVGLLRPRYVIHATPSFHGQAVHPDLIPDYVTSLESQIMVLEVLSSSWQVILVVDMAIFATNATQSEIPVEIPWSEWGPKYTRYFPHHPSHRISVFGSKMAYALPQDRAPEPGQRLEELPAEGSFYVHIWDFNRAISRLEHSNNVYNCNSPGRLIRRPGRLAQTCFTEDDADIITNHPYTTAVCPTGFSTRHFDRFFLEQDRLTLIWAHPGSVQIQVVSPSPIMPTSEVGLDVEQGQIAHSPELQQTKEMQSRHKTNILFYLLGKLRRRPRYPESE
ncbi:uncharacterized protein F5891DRAFT_1186452 [Suillus fuscotomentosus]|uniref:F-box domain-containing protein n=1 Tax=Suillus fuscotomentosus TaxID=1912939 RepID=A0AAD4HP30_9AGAM|nr:uncharacterized protein F5891DRAFT_1186452 [Suillus fuscotomentosus]KAG1902354.1 hypothetical protein F5891DRAFT_1186452 [Suillus fuscotomentosus]